MWVVSAVYLSSFLLSFVFVLFKLEGESWKDAFFGAVLVVTIFALFIVTLYFGIKIAYPDFGTITVYAVERVVTE